MGLPKVSPSAAGSFQVVRSSINDNTSASTSMFASPKHRAPTADSTKQGNKVPEDEEEQ